MRKGSKVNKKSNKWIIIALISIIIICIGIIVYLLFIKIPKEVDYTPGIIDKNAIYSGDNEDKMDKSDGGGAVALSYKKNVAIDLENKKIKLHFKNPSKSTQEIVLQIIIIKDNENIVIAESNRIPPGYSIEELDLVNESYISNGVSEGVFNIMYYDEDTEEKAILNTNIPITIKVN